MVDEVCHQYRLELDTEVRYESPHSYPKRRRRMLFEREGPEIRFREGYGAGGGIRELLTPTTLALSAAMRFEDSGPGRVARALVDMHMIGLRPFGRSRVFYRVRQLRSSSDRWFEEENGQSSQRVSESADVSRPLWLLQMADPSIDLVKLVTLLDGGGETFEEIRFVRSVRDGAFEFGLDKESAGIRIMFALIGPVLTALRDGDTGPTRDRREPAPAAVGTAPRTLPRSGQEPAWRSAHIHDA